MLNMRLIEEATELAFSLAQANCLKDAKEEIKTRAIEWYSNTDIVNVEMLAAMCLSGINTMRKGLTWDDILFIHEFWFPRIPDEYTEDYCTYIHY